VPVDFDSYSVFNDDLKTKDEKENIDEEEQIWRISSLTASIDDDTKILVLPVPESKRS